MRRVSPDPIPTEVVQRMLDAAIRAPSGSNMQAWRWLVLTDRDVIAKLAEIYADAFDEAMSTFYKGTVAAAKERGDDQAIRVQTSAEWLRDNMNTVPLIIVACDRNDPTGASIYPAVWNLMLAARGAGVGTTLTTFNYHLRHDETRELLGVPADKGWRIAAVIPCGYPTGRWGVAKRPPVTDVVYADHWGNAIDWEVNEPLWSDD